MSDYTNYDNLAFDPHKQELLKEVSVMDLRDQLDAKEQMIKNLKALLAECRQKMFEAEKNYGFDDSIIDILTPEMDKIDDLFNTENKE